ncbi:MAG: hypothetical protein HZC02_01435 [Candidatus Levybacteria bacterium]|nr:hypothetical protein [Candidatus Levybacteria bacterium]
MRRILPFFALLLFFVPVAVADDGQKISFPDVTAGPGYILPDSPLYFLDKLYQKTRLSFVFTPENKAKLHMQIAYERLAELRVETSRNNQAGIDQALSELQIETMAAAKEVKDAFAQGKDVTQLARTIHQGLADYRSILLQVRSQMPDTVFEQKLTAAADVLWDAKLATEEALPMGDREHELAANLDQELDEAVMGVTSSNEKLDKRFAAYQKLASRAAEVKLKKEQQEASRSAQQQQRKALIAQRQKAIQDYLVKVEQLRKQREQELAQLKVTIKSLQEQLKQLKESSTSTQ